MQGSFPDGNKRHFSNTSSRVYHLLINPARMGMGLTSGSPTEESKWTSATCGWRDARWRRRTIQAYSFASCRTGVTWWHWSCAPASRLRNGGWRDLRWTPVGVWSVCVTVAGRLLVWPRTDWCVVLVMKTRRNLVRESCAEWWNLESIMYAYCWNRRN